MKIRLVLDDLLFVAGALKRRPRAHGAVIGLFRDHPIYEYIVGTDGVRYDFYGASPPTDPTSLRFMEFGPSVFYVRSRSD